ncbi:MAG: tRNA (guanine(10)-N(2))-dimethyltransferase [Candidatus Altiarchaeales archaeon ex4484_96]|nr:MAG: tRNA (guanine(10)-N(2))-dimethyltransferase [Candidatus Altiarchaeales archaeon ex4484_96]
METEQITEGDISFWVPSDRKNTKKDVVFFNPHMRLNRDISVAVAAQIKPKRYCDLLAGSGVRGLRIAKESAVGCVWLNDANPNAFELIKANALLNKLDVEVSNRDGNSLLCDESFDFIDVDPFGPPVSFVDSTIRALDKEGMLAFSATDTSALCGTYPRAAGRKYDALSLRTDYYNEAGLRIFLGYLIRRGLGLNVALAPVFSHCSRHYFRVYLHAKKSRRACNESLKKVCFLQHCFSCLNRRYAGLDDLMEFCGCGGRFVNAGPLWSGVLADKSFCASMGDKLDYSPDGRQLVELVGGEAELSNPYFNLHKVFHKQKMPARPTRELIDSLKDAGFSAVRTHFCALGLRTDASVEDIYAIL